MLVTIQKFDFSFCEDLFHSMDVSFLMLLCPPDPGFISIILVESKVGGLGSKSTGETTQTGQSCI